MKASSVYKLYALLHMQHRDYIYQTGKPKSNPSPVLATGPFIFHAYVPLCTYLHCSPSGLYVTILY